MVEKEINIRGFSVCCDTCNQVIYVAVGLSERTIELSAIAIQNHKALVKSTGHKIVVKEIKG